MTLAPIAFFAYKRPEHTLRALEALSRCELAGESSLFIFCDGPKRPEDEDGVRKVREVAESRRWCGSVEVIKREENAGLAKSIFAGVSRLCEEYGRVIVLEDDLLVSPSFLRYMNDALDLYKDEERVMQVSGYMFDAPLRAETDAIFLSFTTSWGWGTWHRAWLKFDPAMSGYDRLKNDRKLRRAFNLDGHFDYFSMLEKQLAGILDSWAIQWYLSVFMCNGLVLHPVRTLVSNAGFDGSGTHCGEFRQDMSGGFTSYSGFRFPDQIAESDLKSEIYRFVIGVDSVNPLKRIVNKIVRTISKAH